MSYFCCLERMESGEGRGGGGMAAVVVDGTFEALASLKALDFSVQVVTFSVRPQLR